MSLPAYAVCVVHSAHKYDITLELKMTKKTKKSVINDCLDKKCTKIILTSIQTKCTIYSIKNRKNIES